MTYDALHAQQLHNPCYPSFANFSSLKLQDRRRRRLSPVFERRAFHFATDNVSYRDTSICRHVDKSLILMTNVDNNEKIATL
ncbi:hypothetical protein LSTR_LSTR008593 [Laodelphax striatellus]|uniref:Uncharacterized protein n=1 Tax=Laodelphax striatellus TaxID=195883 RepID=A0A482WVB6_LAOST|nr:hypothetical protein LSTR_LSTR008593 [Laodelphax striatellus]